jgi:hypothetical protein
MPSIVVPRPASDEYDPYYQPYIDEVPGGDLLDVLRAQLNDTAAFLRGIPPEKETYRYAPGKWTVTQVVGHVIDGERVFAYRALGIARGDQTSFPGFDENAYADTGGFDRRTLADIASEYVDVRRATISLFAHLEPGALARRGIANGQPATPRAIAAIIAGHERHHLGVIRARYLS